MSSFVTLLVLLFANTIYCQNLNIPNLGDSINKKESKLPPCKVCSLLVSSFQKGLDKTERGKHEGGDAAWEEQRLNSYKRSEIRLVDIQESLCKDLTLAEDQCHSLAENNEHLLEEWFFKYQEEYPDLRQWLCIEKLEICCPFNKFGPNCDDCLDCNGNGKCKGNGTRKGNGKCACVPGYTGDTCNECGRDYYEAFKDETKLLCSHCHSACADGGCTSAGPKGCRVCRSGWSMEPDLGGCVDIDECARSTNVCHKNQFCVNNEGSYKCLECDRSCDGCTGDGPDLCDECVDGYELRDGLCKEITNDRVDSSLELDDQEILKDNFTVKDEL